MAYLYENSPDTGALRQGEILKGVREIRFKPIDPPGELTREAIADSTEIHTHPLTIVLSPDCDLEWDYQARKDGDVSVAKLMSHVLLCDLEDESTLRGTRSGSMNNRIFRIVKQNRDERYHHLQASSTESGSTHDDYYIDFKRMFALPTEYITHESEAGRVGRLGVLRPPWAQDLTHRFTYFLGRVGLPDAV